MPDLWSDFWNAVQARPWSFMAAAVCLFVALCLLHAWQREEPMWRNPFEYRFAATLGILGAAWLVWVGLETPTVHDAGFLLGAGVAAIISAECFVSWWASRWLFRKTAFTAAYWAIIWLVIAAWATERSLSVWSDLGLWGDKDVVSLAVNLAIVTLLEWVINELRWWREQSAPGLTRVMVRLMLLPDVWFAVEKPRYEPWLEGGASFRYEVIPDTYPKVYRRLPVTQLRLYGRRPDIKRLHDELEKLQKQRSTSPASA